MNRRHLISAGVAMGLGLVLAPDLRAQDLATTMLCVNGHPAPRRPNVVYGNCHGMLGMVRDHIIPLCLGGSDTADNIQYQKPVVSYAKDERERHACETYCANPSPQLLASLQAQFKPDLPWARCVPGR